MRPDAVAAEEPSYGIGDRFERIFVVAFSIGGIAFHAVAALGYAGTGLTISPLWAVAAAVLVLPAPLVTLVVATRGALGTVRTVLRAHVVLFAVVALALIPAVPAGSGPATTSWLIDAVPVAMTAAAVAFPARVVPFAVAAVCLLLFAVRSATSGSPVVAIEEAVDMAMIGTVFAGLAQAVLGAGRSLERATRESVFAAARAAGRSGRRSERIRVGALVHDEILSFLLNVEQISHSAERSRAAARIALAHLAELRRTDPTGPTPSRAVLTAGEFVRAASVRIAEAAPLAVLSTRIEAGAVAVPSPVADALIDATVQAARNAVQHARSTDGAPAAVRASLAVDDRGLSIEVSDDGGGFVAAAVPQNRMGLTTSILGRVTQIAGATAQIASEAGTVVRLEWHR
ncbi:hypothetical protein [Rathayibacter sp. VKM Ac-2857]|uniref:hypothetical protein n=1 Tax=Rathayibacter sp. VKM Ac-2857 TaxID=2739020 RepID=UPI001562FC25|nr:hypothetical protein [Rathayibacter sp. VKM Ac-2857]NQX16062.1 hypothetical protein [Rathayibacter sp. VKM Ac-2857]